MAAKRSKMTEYATKADLQATKADLQTEIRAVRTEVQAVRTDLSADIQAVRTEVQAVRTEVQAVRTDLSAEVRNVGVVVEQLVSKMDALVEGLPAFAAKSDLKDVDDRLSGRISLVEDAVRQNSRDIQKKPGDKKFAGPLVSARMPVGHHRGVQFRRDARGTRPAVTDSARRPLRRRV